MPGRIARQKSPCLFGLVDREKRTFMMKRRSRERRAGDGLVEKGDHDTRSNCEVSTACLLPLSPETGRTFLSHRCTKREAASFAFLPAT
jgi:hypothetical protein